VHSEGKVEFSGSKSIVTHSVIRFHVKFGFEVPHFFLVGTATWTPIVQEVAGVYYNHIRFFLP
jgi:hypothetical protein